MVSDIYIVTTEWKVSLQHKKAVESPSRYGFWTYISYILVFYAVSSGELDQERSKMHFVKYRVAKKRYLSIMAVHRRFFLLEELIMLIRFEVENWLSYADPVTFSMVASKQTTFSHRIAKVGKYNLRALPVSTIYGGNASGKSNLVKALGFLQRLVRAPKREGAKTGVTPFALDNTNRQMPTRFMLEILAPHPDPRIKERAYAFSLSLNADQILEEELLEITSVGENLLYRRANGKIDFGDHYKQADRLRMEYAYEGTDANQLYLSNATGQKLNHFRPIFDWFDKLLTIITPEHRLSPALLAETVEQVGQMGEVMDSLDTGIDGLTLKPVPVPENLPEELVEALQEDKAILDLSTPSQGRIHVRFQDGKLQAEKLMCEHRGESGEVFTIDFEKESDGSQRLFDLIPAFRDLTAPNARKVFVIDELDRSLHSQLTQQLLLFYLTDYQSKSRSQLIFTTHDLMLMDQALFRRDEIWLTERDHKGRSSIYPVSDFKEARQDRHLRRHYLQRRMGGTPKLANKLLQLTREKKNGTPEEA
uniref:ATPase AAA-type core domain-containing protein n=1 Tax=Magnetococcus massalia (strain MO-1) TaxID=451514 RepID=A0A1S7LEZ0_MAGMO|nr:Conserved protein of unknown function [Candidatus Magnetococcus massalia]